MPAIYRNNIKYLDNDEVVEPTYIDIENDSFDDIYDKVVDRSKLTVCIYENMMFYSQQAHRDGIRGIIVFANANYGGAWVLIKKSDGTLYKKFFDGYELKGNKVGVIDETITSEGELSRTFPSVKAVRDYISTKSFTPDNVTTKLTSDNKLATINRIHKSNHTPTDSEGEDGDIWVMY